MNSIFTINHRKLSNYIIVIFCSLCLNLSLSPVNAQNSAKMTIHKTDKSNVTYNLSDIDSITFIPCTSGQCPATLIDSRDGQSYKVVQIGTQCWMSQNLNIGTQIYPGTQPSDNGVIEKYCYTPYNGTPTDCSVYGGLYKWLEMMQYTIAEKAQGICPTGWHIPSNGEWKQMEIALGLTQTQADSTGSNIGHNVNIGGKLKQIGTLESSTGLWQSPNAGATNSSGFTALPGGNTYYTYDVSYVINQQASIWTSTPNDSSTSWAIGLSYDSQGIHVLPSNKGNGLSVRCVKD